MHSITYWLPVQRCLPKLRRILTYFRTPFVTDPSLLTTDCTIPLDSNSLGFVPTSWSLMSFPCDANRHSMFPSHDSNIQAFRGELLLPVPVLICPFYT